MSTVFISYSRVDHFFAELVKIKLEEKDISVWVDKGQLRPGNDWRMGIDKGISGCSVVLLALSDHSAKSSYVTYEWASAMGKGKPIIPVRLNECQMHPKLDPIQYLDFSNPISQPWDDLIERIKEIEIDVETPDFMVPGDQEDDDYDLAQMDPVVKSILDYLDRKGYQMVSFDRIRRRIDENLTNDELDVIVEENNRIFRKASLRGGKPGIAKL